MCTTCGCGSHTTSHDEMHRKGIEHRHSDERAEIEQEILSTNRRTALLNLNYWNERKCFALNIVSSPGSGKTTLLERTVERLKDRCPIVVIEGDQHTARDAERIRRLGIPAIQINTQNGCHLDARMIHEVVDTLPMQPGTLVFIENVGNLVCPALFDLGEHARAVVVSVTEGDDKPLKYPYIFAGADLCIINKIDLLPYVESDIEQLKENVLKINPEIRFFEISASKNQGIDEWCDYLLSLLPVHDTTESLPEEGVQ